MQYFFFCLFSTFSIKLQQVKPTDTRRVSTIPLLVLSALPRAPQLHEKPDKNRALYPQAGFGASKCAVPFSSTHGPARAMLLQTSFSSDDTPINASSISTSPGQPTAISSFYDSLICRVSPSAAPVLPVRKSEIGYRHLLLRIPLLISNTLRLLSGNLPR